MKKYMFLKCTPRLKQTMSATSPQTRGPDRAFSGPEGPSGLEGGAGALNSGGGSLLAQRDKRSQHPIMTIGARPARWSGPLAMGRLRCKIHVYFHSLRPGPCVEGTDVIIRVLSGIIKETF